MRERYIGLILVVPLDVNLHHPIINMTPELQTEDWERVCFVKDVLHTLLVNTHEATAATAAVVMSQIVCAGIDLGRGAHLNGARFVVVCIRLAHVAQKMAGCQSIEGLTNMFDVAFAPSLP